jgi:signal transduction histidine kinase
VITLGTAMQGEALRIWVMDQGPGIPEAFRAQIFQKFSQVDSSDTRQKGGTGLGLSIAKAIVDRHGGTIDFETSDGNGTTFNVDLPLCRANSVPPDAGVRRGPEAHAPICALPPILAVTSKAS